MNRPCQLRSARSARVFASEVTRVALFLSLLLIARVSFGDDRPYEPMVGDEHEITRSYETSSESGDGSTGSSSGSSTLIERIIGVHEGGLEVEYDLPSTVPPDARARYWQYPVRVYRPSSGAMQLLNRPELEARIEEWLEAGGLTREACGRWIFTWNAFLIECDPDAVVDSIQSIDLRVENLSDGALYEEAVAVAPGRLRRVASEGDRETFSVTLKIDPEVVRRERAESDVVVGEITNESVTLEEALSNRSSEAASGTVEITFEADRFGNVWRRTTVTEVEIMHEDGRYERETSTETLERRRQE